MNGWVETLAITNAAAAISSLSPQQTLVYAPPGPGLASPTWSYSHMPFVTWFQGNFYVMYTNAPIGEADLGERVSIKKSPDFASWSTSLNIGPDMGRFNLVCNMAGGFRVYNNVLYAVYSTFEYDPSVLVNGGRPATDIGYLYCKSYWRSTTDGISWTAPVELGPNAQNNAPIKAIASGRLIMACHTMFPYSDNPSGLSGWETAGICTEISRDDADTILIAKALEGWSSWVGEADFYQLTSGEIRMLLRSADNVLWMTKSFDNGQTWSNPGQTSFAHSSSKFAAGRLADGRYYVIGNPPPERDVLSMWTSTDGTTFNKRYDLGSTPYTVQYPGFAKDGAYGYPSFMEMNGEGFVVVSRGKESILGLRFTLPA